MRSATPFRVWVRSSLTCLVCGRPDPDPHHVRAVGMGGTRNAEAADEANVVPLCRVHHDQGHREGWRTFEQRHRLDLRREAYRVWGSWQRGPSWEG
jgi:hypothetical protein